MKLKYTISPAYITIYDSYTIKNEWIMLIYIQKISSEIGKITPKKTLCYINEWCTHNLLYNWGLFKKDTKDVDIDRDGGNFIMRTLYSIGGKLYNLIYGDKSFKKNII